MKIFITFFIIIQSFILLAQDSNELDSIINASLYSYIDHYNYYMNKGIMVKTDLKNFYIAKDYLPNYFTLDSLVINQGVNTINLCQNSKKNKKLIKKGISVIFFREIIINENNLTVGFATNYLSYISTKDVLKNYTDFESDDEYKELKKSKYIINSVLTDGGNFIYEYSCEKKNWVFIKAEYW